MGISELIRRTAEASKDGLPSTPKKTRDTSEIEELSATNESMTNTVRRRRGYRPLSVFTPSMFFPFDGATTKAMDLLDANMFDQLTFNSPKSPATSTESPNQNVKTLVIKHKYATPPLQREIKSSYSSLMFQPPPDPSQHPLFQVDPFTSFSDSPNLVCTSSADEIREISASSKTSCTSSLETCTTPSFGGSLIACNTTSEGSETNTSDEKRRVYIPDYIRSPDPILGKKGFSARTEGSPLANRFQEIIIPTSTTSLPELGEGDKKTGSLRKLSDMFKIKLSGERSFSSSSAPECFGDTRSAIIEPRAVLEERLRSVTYSPQYSYQSNSAFPRHPSTGKSWKSRNLKCTTCLKDGCGRCGRACCAFKAATITLNRDQADLKNRAEALQHIQEITMLYPYGKEAPTFLLCSEQGGIGCGRTVCPDCCGQCPDPLCKDIQCYGCKRDPWSLCEWHVDLNITKAIVSGRKSNRATSK